MGGRRQKRRWFRGGPGVFFFAVQRQVGGTEGLFLSGLLSWECAMYSRIAKCIVVVVVSGGGSWMVAIVVIVMVFGIYTQL